MSCMLDINIEHMKQPNILAPVWLQHQRAVPWEAGLSYCCSRITQGRFGLCHYRIGSVGKRGHLPWIPVCKARQTQRNSFMTCNCSVIHSSRESQTDPFVRAPGPVRDKQVCQLTAIHHFQEQPILWFFKSIMKNVAELKEKITCKFSLQPCKLRLISLLNGFCKWRHC